MSHKRWLVWLGGVILLLVVLIGVTGTFWLPWMVGRELHSAMKRTPYRLVYDGMKAVWPPGVALQGVRAAERDTGRIVATLPRLTLGLALGSSPDQPRLLLHLAAPSVELTSDSLPPWPEDNSRQFIKHLLKNFRFAGLQWRVGSVSLEWTGNRKLTLRTVTGEARARGPDTFQAVTKGAITGTEGLRAEVQGAFSSTLIVRRYLDATMLEHHWDGEGLRVIENGREIKRAGDPWQVRTSVPWVITYPLGQKALKAAMVPEDPRLRSLWERLWR